MSLTEQGTGARQERGVRTGRAHGVADALGRRIASGLYSPGETLPTEPELAAALGVGRNAVREAVKMLIGKGLLRTGRRAGTVVQPYGEWNLLDPDLLSWLLQNHGARESLVDDLMEMRAAIEPHAAALAAERAKVSEALRLWEACEAMERHAGDPRGAIDADVLFHRRLFETAGSRLLLGVFRAFELLLRVNFAAGGTRGFVANLELHRAVAEAVQNGNPEAARAAMLRLLARNREDVNRARKGTTERNVPGPELSPSE